MFQVLQSPVAAMAKKQTRMGLVPFIVAALVMDSAGAQQAHHQHGSRAGVSPAPFIASTAKPFPVLMNDAMAVMEDGMTRAETNGVAEHDFVTMMIPHHQGAIDMAKAVLLYSKDPEMVNLAQGIIAEQQNEIRVMQAWLQRYHALQAGSGARSR
jgi:uncharacterized protein (DUF305 family)